MNEEQWDKLLKIKTAGRDDSRADQYRYPYEPTPYDVLERLAGSGYIGKKHTLLDYGCGKGRVDIFMAWQVRCHSIGIEYDERIYEKALENKANSVCEEKVLFKQENAENFTVPDNVDRIYFFNPFSCEILQKVMGRIMESYYEAPREMLLFFYYPSDEYVSCLMTASELMFFDEIDCRDLFEGNDPRERVMIFQLV